MKKSLLWICGCWLAFFSLSAQPTITDVIIPEAGDSIHLIRCAPADLQEEASGANQNWDFSGLSPSASDPEFYFKFLAPQNTPFGDRYPTADLAAINADSQFVFYTYDGQTLELIGAVAEVPNFGNAFADYTNAETEERFPVTYNDSGSDDFAGMNVTSVASANFSGSVSGVADAYGTLILPSGTFPNVLRVKDERTYQVAGAPAEMSTLYRYMSLDYPLWLLSIETFTNGGDPIIFYQDSPNLLTSTTFLETLTPVEVFPNPLSSGQSLRVTCEDRVEQAFALYNATGQRISLTEPNRIAENTYQVNLPAAIPAGIYFLEIPFKNGSHLEKIVLQP